MTVTFEELARMEPVLRALLKEARAYRRKRGPSFCANGVWYAPGGLKQRLSGLVGWGRKWRLPPGHLLGTEEAYDVAYDTIYAALPDCRDCACL
jgi:hypothetical protein